MLNLFGLVITRIKANLLKLIGELYFCCLIFYLSLNNFKVLFICALASLLEIALFPNLLILWQYRFAEENVDYKILTLIYLFGRGDFF